MSNPYLHDTHGVAEQISDFRPLIDAREKRIDLISKEEKKAGKKLIDLEPGANWKRIIFQNDTPVFLYFYTNDQRESQLLHPVLMDVFLGSNESWKLIAANFDQHPGLAEHLNVDFVPALFIINKGEIVDSWLGYPTDFALGELLRKIQNICKGEPI